MSGEELDSVVAFFMTGNGPRFISPSAVGRDGRAVSADGTAPFQGQVFFNPNAGTLGSLQRRRFSGPTAFNLDASAIKEVKIGERQSVSIMAQFFNLPNHPTFFINDQNINSATFGTITTNFWDRRLMQFGIYYRF
jgi:hypothetical protein